MLGYLGVQKYKGTEILKHKIILELKFMKKPQRLILQFVFHGQGFLCVRFIWNITSVHHMLFRVVHYLENIFQCLQNVVWNSAEKAAKFQDGNAVFRNKSVVCFATSQCLFCRRF